MKTPHIIVPEYHMTTAEILYHLPDHPSLLQTYIWQELDLSPKFPELHRFLTFWERELDGKLHSVSIASYELVTPKEISYFEGEFRIH